MNKIINIINYSIDNVPYYKNFKKIKNISEIKKLPIVKKEDLQNKKQILISKQFYNLDRKKIHIERTSGSTSTFTEIFWINDEYHISNFQLWRYRYMWYKINPTDKYVNFISFYYSYDDKIKKPEKYNYSKNNRILSFSKFYLDEKDLLEYCNKIIGFEPKWMIIQTSILIKLIEVLKIYNIKLNSLKYIELSGEYTSNTQIKYFRKFFGEKIKIANMYGAQEVNCIAYECPYHKMHILEENVYCEKVENKFLVTSLHNHLFPIIRYDLGDFVEIEKNENLCKCGCKSKTIKIIQGRTIDMISLPNKEEISPYVYYFCLEKTNEEMQNSIMQYKLIYSNETLYFYLKISDEYINWGEAIIECLKENINFYIKKHENLSYYFIIKNDLKINGNKFKPFEIL